MSDVLLFFRRFALTALTAAAMIVMAPPAGAACPPASRIIPVDPGRTEIIITKALLLSELPGSEIGGVVPPGLGTLEDAGDFYRYRPSSSFWTVGFDSFLLQLSSSHRGESRVETVLLLPALAQAALRRQDFENGTPAWTPSGQAENFEIFTEETLSGTRSLRVQGLPDQPNWLTASISEQQSGKPGENNTGGGQQGSGAQATLRPPGVGGPGNLTLLPTSGSPAEVVFLNLGLEGISEHKVWARDDGEQMNLRLQGLTGFTPWLPVSRGAHRVQIIQWNGQDANQRTGASLWIDGALAASLTAPFDPGIQPSGPRLKAGVVKVGSPNPVALSSTTWCFPTSRCPPDPSAGWPTASKADSSIPSGRTAATWLPPPRPPCKGREASRCRWARAFRPREPCSRPPCPGRTAGWGSVSGSILMECSSHPAAGFSCSVRSRREG